MKLIRYILFCSSSARLSVAVIILLALFSAGCQKELLNTVPNDRVSSAVFWNNLSDATQGANAAYTYLEGFGNIFTWDGLSDIGHTNQFFQPDATMEQDVYDATAPRILSEWDNAYNGIYAANTYFANVGKVQTTDTASLAVLGAEVRTLRAYHYIHLAILYGAVPLITTPLTVSEAEKLQRTSADSIWDFVESELRAAAGVLPVTASQKGRIAKGAALSLLARAALYAGRYQDAADAASQVMALNAYSLYGSYKDLFSYTGKENPEVILEHGYMAGANTTNTVFAYMAPYSQKSSTNWYVPTKTLVDAYQMANGKDITDPASGFDPYNPYVGRDPRLHYSIFVPGDSLPSGTVFNSIPGSGTTDAVGGTYYATVTGYTSRKYINTQDYANPTQCTINLILLRYAEVYLTYAEAKVELNQLDQSVYDAINKVRMRPSVNMPAIATGLSQDSLRSVVRHERMTELAFEGLRFYDLRRWKTAAASLNGNVYGMTYNDGGTLTTIKVSFSRAFTAPRDYLWPVPYNESLLNPGLGQNPGW
jgi:hypothetical protein